MSLKTDVHLPINPSDDPLRLTGRRLPRWAPAASVAAGLLIGLLLLVTGVKILGLTFEIAASFFSFSLRVTEAITRSDHRSDHQDEAVSSLLPQII